MPTTRPTLRWCATLWLCSLLYSQAAQAAITHPVEDDGEALSAPAREALAARLVALRDATGVPMAILIEEPAPGTRLEDASWTALRTWAPAAQERAVVLYVSPATRRWRLEVGWGVEQALGPARAEALLKQAQPLLAADKLDQALASVIDGVGESIGKGRYMPAAQPPLVQPLDDMGAPVPPATDHAHASWADVGAQPLTLTSSGRVSLPGERWVEELVGPKRIHDHARALSPSWEAAMTRKLTILGRDHTIVVTLVAQEASERGGESLARHADRLMRRWLQLAPGGDRVIVVMETAPAPRLELRTSLGLARLYTPLRAEALTQEALALTGQGGHLERVLEKLVEQMSAMAAKRQALEQAEGGLPADLAQPAPAKVVQPPPADVSGLRLVLVMIVSAAMLALFVLCVWVAWTASRRYRS